MTVRTNKTYCPHIVPYFLAAAANILVLGNGPTELVQVEGGDDCAATVPDLPNSRVYGHSTIIVNTQLLTCGGRVSGSGVKSKCYRFSPGQTLWTAAPSLPRPLWYGAMVTVGDGPATALYIGGLSSTWSNRTEILAVSPDSDSGWTTVANLRVARDHHCAVAVGQQQALVIGKSFIG